MSLYMLHSSLQGETCLVNLGVAFVSAYKREYLESILTPWLFSYVLICTQDLLCYGVLSGYTVPSMNAFLWLDLKSDNEVIGYHHHSQYCANRHILLGKICVVCSIHCWLGSWWLFSWSSPSSTFCNCKNLPVGRKLPDQFPLDFSISCNKAVCLARVLPSSSDGQEKEW